MMPVLHIIFAYRSDYYRRFRNEFESVYDGPRLLFPARVRVKEPVGFLIL